MRALPRPSAHRIARRLLVSAAVAAVVSLGPASNAQDGSPRAEEPVYRLPEGFPAERLAEPLEEAAHGAVATLFDPPTPEDAQDAVRLLAGLGPPAAPLVVTALRKAPWHARAGLVSALAEIDAPALSPVLAAAAGDRSFAVRAAAVVGLGKTGDRSAQAALLARADAAREPVWRVRAEAATALRRGYLRDALDRDAAGAVLVRMLEDPDRDVRLETVRALAPLALDDALPPLLRLFADRDGPRDFRTAALEALSNYRDAQPELVAALRAGFVETEDAKDAVKAGRALFDLTGAAELEDDQSGDTVLRRLRGQAAGDMRAAVAEMRADAAPWLRRQASRFAARIAAGRVAHEHTSIEPVVELLVHVDPKQGAELMREFLLGPDAEVLELATRRFALRVVENAYARAFRTELRTLFDGPAGRDLRPRVLDAIVKSGGDDVPERVDAALDHESRAVRRRALGILKRKTEVPAGPRLRELAESAEEPRLRADALETLARHDVDESLRLAAGLLEAKSEVLRDKAIALLSRPEGEEHFERLVERFREESARTPEPEPGPAPPPPTPEEVEQGARPGTATTRGRKKHTRLRSRLLQAASVTGGERARPVLVETLEGDAEAALREQAARELRAHVRDEDAQLLLRRIDEEREPSLRRALRTALARLGESVEARAYFERRVTDERSRAETLDLLRVDDARVVPPGLAEGLFRKDWKEDSKEAALLTLERAGRAPPPERLAELARTCVTKELCAESLRVLVATGGESADPVLARMIESADVEAVDDQDKLSEIVLRLGQRRVTGAARALGKLLDSLRTGAMAALTRQDTAVELYRRTAIAYGRCGGAEAGPRIVRHLLHPELERAASRLTVPKNGPFQPERSATIYLVRGLVMALAELQEPDVRRAIRAHLDELARDGRDLRLDEGYVDGVALLLRDPAAYELPARRRPDAALELRLLVPRLAPRMSALDIEALQQCAAQFETRGDFDAALRFRRAHADLADVEDAARPVEDRQWERARLRIAQARLLHVAGKTAEALEIAATLREPDPASWQLAYLHGYAHVKLGKPDEAARTSLRYAIGRNGKYASAAFYLAWVTDSLDGVNAALPLYRQAVKLDVKRVFDAGGEYLTHRRGRTHRWAEYPFWHARARLRAGDTGGETADELRAAIRHDDRSADQARRDPVFREWKDLESVVAEALTAFYRD